MHRPSSIPPASRILIRQASETDIDSIVRVCQSRLDVWAAPAPSEVRLGEFFRRALESQDDVFQFWVAENGFGDVVGWESLTPVMNDPAQRRLTAESTMCIGAPQEQLGRMLATHTIRHAARTPIQYIFARVPVLDQLSLVVLEAVGYQEVGLIPATGKSGGQPERIEMVYVL